MAISAIRPCETCRESVDSLCTLLGLPQGVMLEREDAEAVGWAMARILVRCPACVLQLPSELVHAMREPEAQSA